MVQKSASDITKEINQLVAMELTLATKRANEHAERFRKSQEQSDPIKARAIAKQRIESSREPSDIKEKQAQARAILEAQRIERESTLKTIQAAIEAGQAAAQTTKQKEATDQQPETKKQEKLKEFEFDLKEFLLKKGSRKFNKMFPLLGLLMGGVYRGKKDKNDDDGTQTNQTDTTNTNINNNNSIVLSRIIDSQKKSLDILQQILTSIKGLSTSIRPSAEQTPGPNPNTTPPPATTPPQAASNQNQRSSTPPPVTGPRAQMNLVTAGATVAGGAAIATGAGYVAQQAISGSPTPAVPPAAAQASAVPPAATPAVPPAAAQASAVPATKQRSMRRPPKGPAAAAESAAIPAAQAMSSSSFNSISTTAADLMGRGNKSPVQMITQQPRINLRNDGDLNDKFNGKEADDNPSDATPIKSATQEMEERELRKSRILNFKADEIFFKADRFEFEGDEDSENDTNARNNVGPSGNANPIGGEAAGGGNNNSGAGGGNDATRTTNGTSGGGSGGSGGSGSGGGGNTNNDANNTNNQNSTAPELNADAISGLNFRDGVDKRITPAIADKVKDIQSGFGRGVLITSGFRDADRNRNAGGATNSVHLTGNAVDVAFSGNQEDTINFIKQASAKGIRGIGVYGPGQVHIDMGSKRVWGPDYHAESIPSWARAALDEHMTGQTAATLARSSPTSGAVVAAASAQNDMSVRSPAPAPASSPPAERPIAAASAGSYLDPIDPNNPGSLEPRNSGALYARLFSMAA